LAEFGDRSRLAYGAAAIASAVNFGLIHFDWGIVGIIQTTFMGAAPPPAI
jgi:membrane protease YdiL (CAAX protease family)